MTEEDEGVSAREKEHGKGCPRLTQMLNDAECKPVCVSLWITFT